MVIDRIDQPGFALLNGEVVGQLARVDVFDVISGRFQAGQLREFVCVGAGFFQWAESDVGA